MLNDIAYNILLKKGLAANLVLATTHLQQGELAYTTDSKIVYITDASNIHRFVGAIVPYISKSGNYTLKAADYAVVFTATAMATLDSTLPVGTTFRIKLKGTGNVLTIAPSSGLIDDAATAVITTNNAAIDVIFDGTNWEIF